MTSHRARARAAGIPLGTYFSRLAKGQDPTETRPRYRRRKGDSSRRVLNAIRAVFGQDPISGGRWLK